VQSFGQTNTIVAMFMDCDLGMGRDPKHEGIDTGLVWITLEDLLLSASRSGASSAWITSRRKLILSQRQPFFRR
jgi:hypothetical protein